MLYDELKKLTGGRCSYEEFESINAVYMQCDTMTHEQCAAAWRALFGVRYRERKAKAAAAAHSWVEFKRIARSAVEKAFFCNRSSFSLADGSLVEIEKEPWHAYEFREVFSLLTPRGKKRIAWHFDGDFYVLDSDFFSTRAACAK